MQVVILAAGKGKRLKPITDRIPKPLVKVCNKELLWHIVSNFVSFGLSDFIVVISADKFGEMIKSFLLSNFPSVKFRFAIQKEQLGTAHSLLVAEKYVNEDFTVVYGDLFFHRDVLEKLFTSISNEHLLVSVRVDNPKSYGCLEIKNNKLIRIHEKSDKPPSNLINAGIYYFSNGKIFEMIKRIKLSERGEYELTDAMNLLAKRDSIRVIEVDKNKWIDAGTIERLRIAEKMCKEWL
ncbi:MAG: NTP transferase domain-containing protein [Candidatus Aenigmarchaeota archaeon]|nr:NTP transferase domain-containing protein [Candidatus Aenigmarchaeota archaeon]